MNMNVGSHVRPDSDPGLPGAKVGIVALLYANDDLPELTPPIEPSELLDEIRRVGFGGLQLTRAVPRGAKLRADLTARQLRIAEVYAALPCDVDGPPPGARAVGFEHLQELIDCDGDVFVLSYHLSDERLDKAGRAEGPDVPRLTDGGLASAVDLLHELAAAARDAGHRAVYHPHVGTFIETRAEVDRLLAATDPELLWLCLDTGHCTLGGDDAVRAIRRYADRLGHVHLKDVSESAMAQLRSPSGGTFLDALRNRVFTELGDGVLDVAAVARALIDIDYQGWIMSEQDTSWLPPSESAAIARRVWTLAVREASRARVAGCTSEAS
jgi:inosose dehydratase